VTTDTESNSDKAIAILHATNDGNDLAPRHLSLLQAAVNGHLTPQGEAAFAELSTQVSAGTYQRPWFCGVEHLTIRHDGRVFWKDKEVEHYTCYPGQEAGIQASAEELGRRCRRLEWLGIEVSIFSAIMRWEWLEGMQPDCPFKTFLTTRALGLLETHERPAFAIRSVPYESGAGYPAIVRVITGAPEAPQVDRLRLSFGLVEYHAHEAAGFKSIGGDLRSLPDVLGWLHRHRIDEAAAARILTLKTEEEATVYPAIPIP
jgi:hypothetical protein